MIKRLIMLFACCATLNAAEPASNQVYQTPSFMEGYQTFRNQHFKDLEKEFIRLVREGQTPQALFIGCSDSRMVPDLILGTKPGDLFVVRTAGNFVPTYDPSSGDGVGATILYAIKVLNIKHIVVCGHSHCGAIQGLFDTNLGGDQWKLLRNWLKWGEPAKETTLQMVKKDAPRAELYQTAEHVSIIYQLKNLMTYPFVQEEVKNHTIDLHGWYYDIESGKVSYYDPELKKFEPLDSLLQEATR